jgi:NADH dehydrogenase FAD-containing subunit
MADEAKEKRQRKVKRTVRLTTMEDAVLRMHADQAGLTIASYLRKSAIECRLPKPVVALRSTGK